ncbi:MAG: hypothetical protein CVV33_00990 [Methanomicrobiales archaeon HGW-Methanomicrobiales-4]|nr:MAG: hypothetical protein CVV33_00990 [Methanomicrobiales archaeon HGW-Methanomicrobiales-4]
MAEFQSFRMIIRRIVMDILRALELGILKTDPTSNIQLGSPYHDNISFTRIVSRSRGFNQIAYVQGINGIPSVFDGIFLDVQGCFPRKYTQFC